MSQNCGSFTNRNVGEIRSEKIIEVLLEMALISGTPLGIIVPNMVESVEIVVYPPTRLVIFVPPPVS